MQPTAEHIICAAVVVDGQLYRGGCHVEAYGFAEAAVGHHVEYLSYGPGCGFITSAGRFVTREEGVKVAISAGQVEVAMHECGLDSCQLKAS